MLVWWHFVCVVVFLFSFLACSHWCLVHTNMSIFNLLFRKKRIHNIILCTTNQICRLSSNVKCTPNQEVARWQISDEFELLLNIVIISSIKTQENTMWHLSSSVRWESRLYIYSNACKKKKFLLERPKLSPISVSSAVYALLHSEIKSHRQMLHKQMMASNKQD